jgi:hypothetical protein
MKYNMCNFSAKELRNIQHKLHKPNSNITKTDKELLFQFSRHTITNWKVCTSKRCQLQKTLLKSTTPTRLLLERKRMVYGWRSSVVMWYYLINDYQHFGGVLFHRKVKRSRGWRKYVLWNTGNHLQDYMMSQPWRPQSTFSPARNTQISYTTELVCTMHT